MLGVCSLPGRCAAATAPVTPNFAPHEQEAFARRIAQERGLNYPGVLALLQEARHSATVVRLIAPSGPQRKRARIWPHYRQRHVEPVRIREGITFMRQHADVLARAQARYGVPGTVIAAIIGIETLYGRQMGQFRVLDTLTTLAFHYPVPQRGERVQLFRAHLADLIELHFTTHLDARTLQGSFAGAVGIPQFMPGSIKRYAVDADGDGRIDLLHSIDDAVMSVANFLHQHGWQADLPVFAPAQLPDNPAAWVDGGLAPTLSWQPLQRAGARATQAIASTAWQNTPLGVIDLPDERTGRVEYRLATPNFFALTSYNRSYFYAAAVADLAAVLDEQPGAASLQPNTPVDK